MRARWSKKNEVLGKELQAKAGIPAEQPSDEKKWVTLEPEVAKARAIAWIMNDQKPTTNFANYQLNGILWDWQSDVAKQQKAQNQFPRLLPVNSTKIFSYKFETIDPRTIKMSEMIDIIGKMKFKEGNKRLSYPKYPLPDVNQLKEIKRLSKLGFSQAEFKLGQLYQAGKGVEKDYEQAHEHYLRAAKQLNSKAEYNLGIMYLKGIGVEKNYDTAFNWLEKSAFRGNSFAQFTLGSIFENGIIDRKNKQLLKKDLEYARNMYSLAATSNSPGAHYRLAELHLSGLFNEINSVSDQKSLHKEIKEMYESAVKNGNRDAELSLAYYYVESPEKSKQKWAFEVANRTAKKENPFAIFLLALLYDRGIGVDIDREQAIKLYKKAVQFDNPVAEFILGTYYYNGDHVQKDEHKALAMLKKAAKKEQPFALYNLAVIMHNTNINSNFIPLLKKAEQKNYIKAKLLLADYEITRKHNKNSVAQAAKIYNELGDAGYEDAQVKLGFMYEHGINYKINYEQAAQWYRKAAKQGNQYAQYFLANIYQVGKLGKPSFTDAQKWYAQAANQNFLPAIIALGFINETMVYDYKEALKWYQKATEHNNPIGLYNLGLMYEYGKGIPVNYVNAYEVYNKAIDLEFKPAIYNVAHLYLNGLGVEKDLDKARELFQRAASHNNNYAQYQLAMIYENGLGIEKDAKRAFEYFKQSAQNGNDLATLEIKRRNEAAKQKLDAEEKTKTEAKASKTKITKEPKKKS